MSNEKWFIVTFGEERQKGTQASKIRIIGVVA
jgi:hypothetical protein